MIIVIEYDERDKIFAPGETIAGQCRWKGIDARTSSPGELHLLWRTEGRGTQDVGLIETQTFSASQSSASVRFSWKLPQEPYSFSGKLISVVWCVEAVIEGQVEREDFILSPFDREIVL